MLVAPAALTALCDNIRLVAGNILNYCTGLLVADNGTAGNSYDKILAVLAGLEMALTVNAVGCHIFTLIAEVHKGGHIIVGNEDNVAASAAVTAVGTARSDILLAMESDGAVAALTGNEGNCCFIYKHLHDLLKRLR